MGGWHHQLNAHEFEQTLGDSEGQGVLACCSPWGHKKSDTTERIDKYEGRYVEGKNICCVLLLSGLVFKRKPKKQKYSKVKKELEFPFPIRTINEIIPLRWFPARHFEMRAAAAAAAKSRQSCPTLRPHRRKPTRFPRPWDSPGKNTGVGCHFLLQCRRVKSEREVAKSCPTLRDPMDFSLPGSSIHGIFQALRHNLWPRTQGTLASEGCICLSLSLSLSVSLSHTHRVDLRFYQKSHNLWLSL